MKLIVRQKYLDKLISATGTPDIKVITGIRRSGKSKLLDSYIEHIKATFADANIVHIDFNSTNFEQLTEYHALNDYVQSAYIHGVRNFLCIDEVQMCKGFERAINSIHASEKFDIYITGSNAFLLSSDLATLFTGRTFEIEVFPFSFCEFCRYFNYPDLQSAFEAYTKEGGMSGSYLYSDIRDKYKYIKEVFDTLVVRDICQKYKIRNRVLLDNISDFMLDNISNISSLRNIADTLEKQRFKTNDKTVGAYIKYLCDAFVFYKIRRYDIRGKRYLMSQDKYYLTDHSFRYAKLGTKNLDYGRVYENIVATELLRRGYEIYAGFLYKKEIDFVAVKQNEKIYIQVADDISAPSTFERETASLLKIEDAYPKMIIARTGHETYQYEGIAICDIARWLIGEE